MRQRILLVVMTGLALLVPAAAASASSSQYTTVEAPGELLYGGNPGPALDEVESLGAQAIRLLVNWREIAPEPDAKSAPSFNATDPSAYPDDAWNVYDTAITSARARGIRVHLSITGPAPDWATRKHDGLTKPDPAAFGKFATAVGRRYGKQVAVWSIWNEPNLGKLLKPIAKNQSATVYRNLYLKAYAGLRSARVRAPIVLGEFAPRGNRLKDQGTIAPLAFLRSMLCLDKHYRRARGKRCAKVPAQGVAVHPYSTAAGPFLTPPNKDDVTIGVLSRLTTAIDKAAKAGAITGGRLPIYVTEFGVQSYPDKRLGVPLDKQSDFRSISERIAYLDKRVKAFSQYLLRDDAPTGSHSAFESGLFLYKNRQAKPALEGFRMPLVVVPSKKASRATLWGLVRPARSAKKAGTVTIQFADKGKRWRKLANQRFGRSGYWKRAVNTKKGRAFRVIWKAPDGTKHVGPKTVARTRP